MSNTHDVIFRTLADPSRRAIFELMTVTGEVRRALLRGASSVEIKEQARRDGMRTLIEDGWRLVCEGTTSPAEVMRVSKDEGEIGI